MLTRRALLASAAATAVGATLAACSRTPAGGPALQVVGGRARLLSPGQFGMFNAPDGHISVLDVAGSRRMWLSSGLAEGGGRTVVLDAADPARPRPLGGGDAVAGLAPAGGTTAFDADYSAPGSVFPSADGRTLWLVYHGENHTFAGVTGDGEPYYATIGLASSDDGGVSWTRRGPVVSGQVPRDDRPAPREVVGAGIPCALVDEDHVYLFYLDWNLTTPDEIHLARAPLQDVADPSAWRKWHRGAFTSPGDGGPSTAVVRRPGVDARYAGGASVSWNTQLQSYLLVFQSADGFWWTRSADLTTWAAPVRFLAADDPVLAGATFVGYPTLLTPGSATDQQTGPDTSLHLALAEEEGQPHSLWRIPVAVTTG